MLGALFRICQKCGLERFVLLRSGAARPCSSERSNGHGALAHAYEDFGAGSCNGKAAEIEEIQKRSGIDSPQRAVKRKRRQLEGRLEALREDDLENVAGGNVFLGNIDHPLIFD